VWEKEERDHGLERYRDVTKCLNRLPRPMIFLPFPLRLQRTLVRGQHREAISYLRNISF
jgi:hypothetical protein